MRVIFPYSSGEIIQEATITKRAGDNYFLQVHLGPNLSEAISGSPASTIPLLHQSRASGEPNPYESPREEY